MTEVRSDDLRQLAIMRLIDAASAQERGDLWAIDHGFEEFEARVPADVTPGEALGVVLRFWDGWIDARNHDWHHYEPLTAADWPCLARQIATELSSGPDITNVLVLQEFGPASARAHAAVTVPIHGCIRAAAALVGTIIGFTGLGEFVFGERRVGFGLLLLAWGALMWLPALARPRRRTRAGAAANERRVSIGMFAMFGLSMLAYGLSYLVKRGYFPTRNAFAVARQLAHLGAALWLVMFILLFFVAYYQAQTHRSTQHSGDEPEDGGA
jgi:hypothetical protein